MNKLNLGIPAGIGDASWLVSKLVNAPEWPNIKFIIADGWPYRTKPLFDMLRVESEYGKFNYEWIVSFEQMHRYKNWSDISSNGYGCFYLQPNTHIEMMHLSEYLPDLKTSYHYELKTPSIKSKRYYKRLSEGKWIGISAASYRGHEAWNTWSMDKWKSLIKQLIKRDYNICLLGGSWDDLTRGLEYELPKEHVLSLVGQTTFEEACSVQKKLSFYIGFCSGLGIIRTVLDLPTLMLFPEHLQSIMYSWSDPQDHASGKYVALSYLKPREIFSAFKHQEEVL
jgi:hypothetical protein